MKKLIGTSVIAIAILAILAFSLPPIAPFHAHAQQNVFFSIGGYIAGSDPCQNPTVAKTSVPIAITTATTTELVAASTGKTVYACAFKASIAGTTPTIKFEYGTKVSTACDTGATALTGAFAPTAGTVLGVGESGQVQFQSVASNELCAVTTGTGSPSFQGYLVEVQQ